MRNMMLRERNYKILALCALLLSAAGTVGATAPKGVFSVGDGVYVTLADENEQRDATSNLFKWREIPSLEHDGWRALTSSEWSYLLVTRDVNGNSLGTVNGKPGLIILPDNFVLPEGLSFIGNHAHFEENIYSSAEWAQMSAAGAVFLPADGYGYNDGSYKTDNVNSQGNYWSSTPNPSASEKAYVIQFEELTIHNKQSYDTTMYYSVRLAQTVTVLDENDDATTFSSKFAAASTKDYALMKRTLYKDGYFNTICLPFNVNSIAASPLAGAEIFTFDGGRVVETGSGNELQLQLSPLTGDQLTKGVPYMIRWTSGDDLSFLKFDNIVWGTGSAAGQTGDAKVTFRGFYPMTHIEELNHYNLFLGADDVLYWPIADGKSMKGFRAYWLVDHSQPTPAPIYRGMPASLYIRQKTGVTTGLENEEMKTKSAKLLREGRVVLLINGEPYSIGGQKL